jgi:hypothetical protein
MTWKLSDTISTRLETPTVTSAISSSVPDSSPSHRAREAVWGRGRFHARAVPLVSSLFRCAILGDDEGFSAREVMPEKIKLLVKKVSEPNVSMPCFAVIDEATGRQIALFEKESDAYDYFFHRCMTGEERLGAALTTIGSDYRTDVRDMAESIKDQLIERLASQERGEPLREWLVEYIHEAALRSVRVTNGWRAMMGVISALNDGAYFKKFGNEGVLSNGFINWSRLCFPAFEADVIQRLSEINVDVEKPVPKCDRCFQEDQEERYRNPKPGSENELLCRHCRIQTPGWTNE